VSRRPDILAHFDRAAFGACDDNGDNLVTTAELALLWLSNQPSENQEP
jgi:hypothetical protein